MTKTFCDNCEAETSTGYDGDDVETRLHPSNIPVLIQVRFIKSTAIAGIPKPVLCINCYLTALHRAFKQPENTNANTN